MISSGGALALLGLHIVGEEDVRSCPASLVRIQSLRVQDDGDWKLLTLNRWLANIRATSNACSSDWDITGRYSQLSQPLPATNRCFFFLLFKVLGERLFCCDFGEWGRVERCGRLPGLLGRMRHEVRRRYKVSERELCFTDRLRIG